MYAGPRATLDIDIVVDETGLLRRLEEFCQAFPPPRYYADPEALRESLQDGYMNNILDTDSGLKADIIPLKAHLAISRDAIRRRRRLIVDDGSGEARYVAAPEDIIVAKLVYYAQWGRSEKHRRDILQILQIQGQAIDVEYVSDSAQALGPEIAAEWKDILEESRGNGRTGQRSLF